MLIEKIENNLNKIVTNLNKNTFIYDLLIAYQQPKAAISRLKKGDYNLSNINNEIIWKKKLLFHQVTSQDPHIKIDEITKDSLITKYNPRFVIVTNFKIFLAVDTKTKQTLDIPFNELSKHADFFLPWAGLEKFKSEVENPADIKAAEKMGRLYDIIIKSNEKMFKSEAARHDLNIFFSRLLFCFFAEDSDIFLKNQFTNSIASHTEVDGSDLKIYLGKLFKVLNSNDRKNYPKFLNDFPYVNGGLFFKEYKIPELTKEARKIILECGELQWISVNPDILGSMMQAVVSYGKRSDIGMHYTSVTNILKVLNPILLDNLYEKLSKAENNENKLKKILKQIYELKIFDPACGSGNFLVIAYKELCKLEIEIYKRLKVQSPTDWILMKSGIHQNQFYGIEIDDYASGTTKVSLAIAEHQMNLFFEEVFGETRPTLPLQNYKNIVCANSARVNWENICTAEKDEEIYVIGNPPYRGFSERNSEQQKDIEINWDGATKLDYVSIWFLKASKYIKNKNAKFAFVSTNSINQGEQVSLLWPHIFNNDLEIFFAHKSIKWTNSSKNKATVTCSIIGISKINKSKKFLYREGIKNTVESINPYLIPGKNIIIYKRTKPLSKFPNMSLGDMAKDGSNLVLSKTEKDTLIKSNPEVKKYLKKFLGGIDFLRGEERWCLWVLPEEYEKSLKIPFIKKRFELVSKSRSSSKKKATKEFSKKPYRFVEIRNQEKPAIFVPTTTSERRRYIPIGFVNKNCIITAPNQAIYDPPNYLFSVMSSRMHMLWIETFAGRLEDRYRYSSELCYNTFPFVKINENQKKILEEKTFKVLDIREKYSEKTISELYDPDKMPKELLEAHEKIDLEVEKSYRPERFNSDEERLDHLFKVYENMLKQEKGNLI